jgi:hypothetical protein
MAKEAEATFTKLRSGAWGLRITKPVIAGDVVLAKTKANVYSNQTVGEVVWSGNGVFLCTIGEKPKKAAPKRPAQLEMDPYQNEDPEIRGERLANTSDDFIF